jgi:outer membrane lipoprotein LolB
MKRLTGIVMLAFAITGCSTVTTPPPAPEVNIPKQDRQAALNKIQNWDVSGKIAVQTPKDSGSASVDWAQNHNKFMISLLGPLGSGGMKLSGQPGNVTLITSDGKSYTAASPEQLLAEKWGFHLPVSNLKYWIRGLPAPGSVADTRFDTYGRLSELSQQGWRVRYLGYSRINGIDLPTKIFANSSALNVKMMIYNWKVG